MAYLSMLMPKGENVCVETTARRKGYEELKQRFSLRTYSLTLPSGQVDFKFIVKLQRKIKASSKGLIGKSGNHYRNLDKQTEFRSLKVDCILWQGTNNTSGGVGMKRDVANIRIKELYLSARCKIEHQRANGLLQPVRESLFEMGQNIYVFRYRIFPSVDWIEVPARNRSTTRTPSANLTDRDTTVHVSFLERITERWGTSSSSVGFHPETDGQFRKRTIHTLGGQCYVHEH
ncbi:hypothetical protein Tco_1384445 [Tanacetum coccineum]